MLACVALYQLDTILFLFLFLFFFKLLKPIRVSNFFGKQGLIDQ